MQSVNHFVRVDQAWSYNLIGSLKGTVDVDMRLVNDVFSKTAAFLMAKHNFYLTNNNLTYNHFIHAMQNHLDGYSVGHQHFVYYFENLFRIISPALGQIKFPIIGCLTVTSDMGEIEGFVFNT